MRKIHAMNHWQRLFTYTTGTIVIGLLLIILTNSFLHYVNEQGAIGYITLFAYGLVYLNLGYGINRRFALKSHAHPAINYLMSFLMAAPTILWIFTKDEGLGDSLFVFTATILFAVFLGTYFGIQKGTAKRKAYIRKIYEDEGQKLPDDLKRSHDDLNKN